jgi:hypothetical protein
VTPAELQELTQDCNWCGWPVGHAVTCAMAVTHPKGTYGWDGLTDEEKDTMRRVHRERYGTELKMKDGSVA